MAMQFLVVEPTQLRWTSRLYDYRVILHSDGSTRSMKLPLESYSTDDDAGVGSWVLLEVEQEEARIRKSRRATTPNVRHSELPT